MKKHLLSALFMLLTLATCYAQEQEQEDALGPRKIQRNHNELSGADAINAGFGIKGGVNFADVYGQKNLVSTDPITDFHAGVYAQFALSRSLSLQVESLYSRKGFEMEAVEHRFDYLEVPLLAVYNLSDRFSLHLGPQVSIMMAAKQDGRELNLDDLNTFDYGLAGGAEARFSFVRVGARYNRGFTDLLDEGDNGLTIGRGLKNNVLQVYIGLGF